MSVERTGTLMRIYLSEGHRRGGKSASRSIVEALAAAGIAGATAFKGIEGFGSHRVVSSERSLDAWADLPIVIEVVDAEETIRGFIPALETILDDGLVTLERVRTVLRRSGPA